VSGSRRRTVDLDGDGVLDLLTESITNVTAYRGRRQPNERSWRQVIAPGVATVGVDVVPADLDRGGRPRGATVSVRPYTGGVDDAFNERAAGEVEAPASFFEALGRLSSLTLPDLVPLTAAFYADGDVRLTHVIDPATRGERVRVANTFGLSTGPGSVDRDGLDLSAASPRGIVIELPIASHVPDALFAAMGTLHVYARHRDWLRADEVPEDPYFGNSAQHDHLPLVTDSFGTEHVLRIPTYTWSEIPRAPGDDLTAGSGTRFAIDGRHVRVLTDRLGVFQAFYEPDLAADGCAGTRAEQFDGMSGCLGAVTRANAGALCAPGWQWCSARDWVERRGATVPTHNYWVSDTRLDMVVSGGCAAQREVSATCTSGQHMRVCGAATDAEGNTCGAVGTCGFEDTTVNDYFGGCDQGTTAGALCCLR
jgi:hypothetical protein